MIGTRLGKAAGIHSWILGEGITAKKRHWSVGDRLDGYVSMASLHLSKKVRQGGAISWILLFFFLTACARETPVMPTATTEPTRTPVSLPTQTKTPVLTMTPTPVPVPTQIVPEFTVENQVLRDDGQFTIAAASLPQAGWLVVYSLVEGQKGDVVGYAAVPAGTSQDIPLTIDPLQATSELLAVLHVDAGEAGVFEYPGVDVAWQYEDQEVSAAFEVDNQAALPTIRIEDQVVTEEGLVQVDNVYSPAAGWLLIHADAAGAIGPVLGFAWLPGGSMENVTIPIQWREGTPRLYGILYEDAGRPNRLDEAEDLPLLVRGQPIVVPFAVALPPDVFVLDQPVVNGQVVIERVVSQGPSWLVIYFDDEGVIGRIIGYAPLSDGVNEQVVVDVVERSVTPNLHILLHEDTVVGDEFDFPAADPPRAYDGRLPAPFTFRTNPGNYLITRDQELLVDAEDGKVSVIVPLVVVDAPTWVVIRRIEDNGDEGAVLGMASLSAGISRDIEIPLDSERTSGQLMAVLHLDGEDVEQFDYPTGADVPLRHSGNIIQAPFRLRPGSED